MTNQEIFKDIKGFEGFYQISNFGRVKSLSRKFSPTERILKVGINSQGYYSTNFSKDGKLKSYAPHHLVWDAFGNKKRNGMKLQVDHIDNNRLNNRIDNLQLLSNRENCTKYNLQNDKSTSKYVGVCWNGKKWQAGININGKTKYLRSFTNEYDAHLAYQKALGEING